MVRFFQFTLATFLLLSGAAEAGSSDAKPVIVRVIDVLGAPIPNAWVRLPDTEGRRMVDASGKWEASSIYELDGSERVFVKGMILNFTISAPGYTSRSVEYEVRGRRNLITIPLETMQDPDFNQENDQELMIRWFQRTYVEEED